MRFIPAVSLVQIQLQPPIRCSAFCGAPVYKARWSRGLRHRPFTAVTRVRIPSGSPEKKHPLSTDKGCFLFNEINPLRDLWNTLCVWNIASQCEMPAGVGGFISFHLMRSIKFHNSQSELFHICRKANISLYSRLFIGLYFRGAAPRKRNASTFLYLLPRESVPILPLWLQSDVVMVYLMRGFYSLNVIWSRKGLLQSVTMW